MTKKTIHMLCALGTAAVLNQAAWSQDLAVNRLLASQCAQCHGTNGHAVGDMDGLSDESLKDLYEDLAGMKGEDRPEDIMDHQALGYTDEQILRIAHYYGSRAGKADEWPESDGESRDDEDEYESDTASSDETEKERKKRLKREAKHQKALAKAERKRQKALEKEERKRRKELAKRERELQKEMRKRETERLKAQREQEEEASRG